MGYFAYDKSLTSDDLAQARYEGSIQPGFQESFSSMFPAPRQRWVEAMTVPDEEIQTLPHRTLIVHGREDQVIPLETSLKLMQLLDNADLSVFSHCGHWSMIERRDDFNRQVRDFFLEQLETGQGPPRCRRKAKKATGDSLEDRDPGAAARIYEVMVLTRAVEDRMVAMYKGGDLLGSLYTGHWHEAISVGAASTPAARRLHGARSTATSARTCGAAWSRGR